MSDIATSSVGEGLDFAFNLIADALARAGQNEPLKAPQLLQNTASYVRLRYAGELRLAFEYLEGLGGAIPNGISFGRDQFARQLDWLRDALGPDDA